MFQEMAICMQCSGGAGGCLVCKRKKIKASLFGCGRRVLLIPGNDYIPSLMIVGAINLVLYSRLDPQISAL